jgi:hypothetical protein
MSVMPLNEQEPDDAEEVLIAWLSQLRRTSNFRVAGDVLPFTLVAHVAGTENMEEGTAAPVCSAHTFTDKSLGRNNMTIESKATHNAMLRLGMHCDIITLSDGRKVGVDYVEVIESPLYMPYLDEQVLRKVGRYEIGLTYHPTS